MRSRGKVTGCADPNRNVPPASGLKTTVTWAKDDPNVRRWVRY